MWKEDLVYTSSQTKLVISKNHFRYFDNLRTAFVDCEVITKEPDRIRKDALLSTHVQLLIEKHVDSAPLVKRLDVRKDLQT